MHNRSMTGATVVRLGAADKVLEVTTTAGEPLNAGKVNKAMDELKKDGRIESPKRCYWTPTA